MCNTTTLQSFCQHSCWSQITAYLAATRIVATAGGKGLCSRPLPTKNPPALAILARQEAQTFAYPSVAALKS